MKCPVCGKDVEPFVLDIGSSIRATRVVTVPALRFDFAPHTKLWACPECGVIRLNLEGTQTEGGGE